MLSAHRSPVNTSPVPELERALSHRCSVREQHLPQVACGNKAPAADLGLIAAAQKAPRATLCLATACRTRSPPSTTLRSRGVRDVGTAIGIYTPERSIIDAFRTRRIEGDELGHEALRRWLRRRGSQPGELLELARQFPRAAAPLRVALEVLL
jgi:hypothetical protein